MNLKAHDKKASHVDAATSADLFLMVMSGKQPPVHQQTNIAFANRVAANKKRLVPIVKIILLCGRQTFALTGHDDSTKTIEAQPTSNLGNFKALLQFRVDAGNKDLELHMKTAPKNATYCSETFQNEIIDVICTLIRKHIVECVKKCRFYSVIADEVTDAANREQLSLIIRYFDHESKTAAERLLDFTQGCGSGSGGSGPFSVEAKARKFHRFRFHIGGKNGGRKKLVLLSFVEERIGGGISIKKCERGEVVWRDVGPYIIRVGAKRRKREGRKLREG